MGHGCQLVWWDVTALRTSWSQALWSPAGAPQIKSGAPWGTQLALSINEDEKLPYREEKITAGIFALMVRLCELGFLTNPQRCHVASPYMW